MRAAKGALLLAVFCTPTAMLDTLNEFALGHGVGPLSPARAWAADSDNAASGSAVASVVVRSRLDPNAILITEIDVVFVYEQALIAEMPDTKREWYSNKRSFTRRAGDGLDVVTLFVPQGFDSDRLSLPARRAVALSVLVCASHDSAQARPVDIASQRHTFIEIDPFGIRVGEREEDSP